jgi:hypothetical protein
MQRARRRFSPTCTTTLEAGRGATTATEEQSKHNKGIQRSFQCCDNCVNNSTIQHEFYDVEKESLRQEVEQLREALRLTTMELSAMNDTVKELKEDQFLRLEECQILQQNMDQCQAEGEEMLNDLLDSTACVDDLKQKLALKEEAFNKLEESHHKVNQERDELVDEICTSHVENGDLFDMQEKMEQLQQRARHNTERQAAEITELQLRLQGVSREQEDFENRIAILQQHSIKQRRAFRRASVAAAAGSNRSGVALRTRSCCGRRRFKARKEAQDKVLKDATSLLTVSGDTSTDDEKIAPTINLGGAQIVAPLLPAAPQDKPTRCSNVLIAAPILSREDLLAVEFSSSARLGDGLSRDNSANGISYANSFINNMDDEQEFKIKVGIGSHTTHRRRWSLLSFWQHGSGRIATGGAKGLQQERHQHS